MKRFFERVRQKGLDVGESPVVIVALGDSVTQGAMEYGRLDPEGVYHRLLQRKLEACHPMTTFSTINAGVSGNTANKGLQRLERDVIRYQPDLVLVAFGLNDSLGGEMELSRFQNALRSIIMGVRERTQADVVLLTPPFMADSLNARIHSRHAAHAEAILKAQREGMLDRYAEEVRETSRLEGVPLADVHAEWTRLEKSGVPVREWLANGLNHPDPRGHRLVAEVVASMLFSKAHEAFL